MRKATTDSETYPRINIYLPDGELHTQIKIAAARQGVTISAYCLEAILRRIEEEDSRPLSESTESPQAAAQALDRLRRQVGRIGVPVRELIAEGRTR